MKFKEAFDKSEYGDKLMYGICCSFIINKGAGTLLNWDNKSRPTYNEIFNIDEWYIENGKIEVTIGDKTGYISKESAEELKKMLS